MKIKEAPSSLATNDKQIIQHEEEIPKLEEVIVTSIAEEISDEYAKHNHRSIQVDEESSSTQQQDHGIDKLIASNVNDRLNKAEDDQYGPNSANEVPHDTVIKNESNERNLGDLKTEYILNSSSDAADELAHDGADSEMERDNAVMKDESRRSLRHLASKKHLMTY